MKNTPARSTLTNRRRLALGLITIRARGLVLVLALTTLPRGGTFCPTDPQLRAITGLLLPTVWIPQRTTGRRLAPAVVPTVPRALSAAITLTSAVVAAINNLHRPADIPRAMWADTCRAPMAALNRAWFPTATFSKTLFLPCRTAVARAILRAGLGTHITR